MEKKKKLAKLIQNREGGRLDLKYWCPFAKFGLEKIQFVAPDHREATLRRSCNFFSALLIKQKQFYPLLVFSLINHNYSTSKAYRTNQCIKQFDFKKR